MLSAYHNYPPFLLLLLIFVSQCFQCFGEVLRLNRNNFEENVFENDDPWIIGIRQKILEEDLENVYDDVKDRINLGSIDESELVAFLQDIVSYNFGFRYN